MKRKPEPIHNTVTHASKDPDTLFEITGEIKLIIRDITDIQGDPELNLKQKQELIEERTDELLDLMDDHEDKYEAYVHVIKNATNSATGNKEIADMFQSKATALNNLAKRLKETLLRDMQEHNLTKVDAGIFSIRTQTNSIPTLTVSVPAVKLPKRFQRVEPDNDELRHALSTGEEVEGVTLEKGKHIRISARA